MFDLKYFPKIFQFAFFTFALVHLVKSYDQVQQYVDDINAVIKHAERYQYRRDNSDIYSHKNTEELDFGEYEFVIVGAGSAGAILAKRLSEYKFKTLLLEAGGPQSNLTDIPGIFKLFQKSDINWGYKTAPQKYACQGMVKHQCSSPRGKVMGGTSVLNGMLYARGNAFDLKVWKNNYGITGWTWSHALRYFKKMENCEAFSGDPEYRGLKGPVHIDTARPPRYLNHIFLQANEEFYKTTNDYNGQQQYGAGLMQFNKKDGRRVSTNRAYLTQYDTNYLTIETNAFVTKVLIEDKVATGIEFIKNNKKYHVKASKEVILSAGTINSPQILMLSGIGPKDELSKFKIPLIVDLPVGQNLDDHIAYVGTQFTSNLNIMEKDKPLEDHVWDYLSHTGVLSDTGMQGISFLSVTDKSTPDIEMLFAASGRGIIPGINDYNFNEETLKALAIPDDEIDGSFIMLVVLLQGKSRGTVTLRSKNPRDFPIFNPNSLSSNSDIATIYKALKYIKSLEDTNAFKAINAKVRPIHLPACARYEYDSSDYWHCTISHLSHQLYHPVGTCAMGKEGNSVLDNKFNVRGIARLRVVDASAAPIANSGHTNAMVMMMAERAADIINHDHA